MYLLCGKGGRVGDSGSTRDLRVLRGIGEVQLRGNRVSKCLRNQEKGGRGRGFRFKKGRRHRGFVMMREEKEDNKPLRVYHIPHLGIAIGGESGTPDLANSLRPILWRYFVDDVGNAIRERIVLCIISDPSNLLSLSTREYAVIASLIREDAPRDWTGYIRDRQFRLPLGLIYLNVVGRRYWTSRTQRALKLSGQRKYCTNDSIDIGCDRCRASRAGQ